MGYHMIAINVGNHNKLFLAHISVGMAPKQALKLDINNKKT